MCGQTGDVSQGSWAVPALDLMQHLSSDHSGIQVTGVKIEFCHLYHFSKQRAGLGFYLRFCDLDAAM